MKKNLIIIIPTIVIIILIISSLFVYAGINNQNKTPKLEEKVSQEIKYLNSYLIAILGDFNGLTIENSVFQLNPEETELEKSENNSSTIESEEEKEGGNSNNKSQGNEEANQDNKSQDQSDANNKNNQSGASDKTQTGILNHNGKYETKWSEIKKQVEEIYTTWNAIALDLHALNVDGNSILSFSNILNSATQNIKKEDKQKSMENLGSLSELLAQYMNSYSSNSREKEMLNVEVQTLLAYINVTGEKWDEALKNANVAEQSLAGIINSVEKNDQKQGTINQCYILVNELRNAINIKDKDIFYIQYQNLITKMEILF